MDNFTFLGPGPAFEMLGKKEVGLGLRRRSGRRRGRGRRRWKVSEFESRADLSSS